MTAVLKREFKAYFAYPLGYAFLAVFYAFAGYFFYTNTLAYNAATIGGVFYSLSAVIMFLVPVLTMRLFSAELHAKTDRLLLTSPAGPALLALGKYLAAVLVYAMGLAVTLVFGLIVDAFQRPNWGLIFGNFTATLLFGMALIAIGMFISALTESQVLAAVSTFAVVIFLMFADSLAALVGVPWVAALLQGLSFLRRINSFSLGVFEVPSIIFFASVIVLFVFLTALAMVKRRRD